MSEALEGFLVIDKPAGITSFGCVSRVRRLLGEKRVGHCGTLDPMARGILVILVGKACRQQERFLSLEKDYWFRARFGTQTTTGDREGQAMQEKPFAHVTETHLTEVLSAFTGPIMQIPPRYAALKYQGKPYYAYARKGQEIPRVPRPVTIHQFDLLSLDLPMWEGRVRCSRGTYVRTLIEDVADRLGTVATLMDLLREKVGSLSLDRAIPLNRLDSLTRETLAACLSPVDSAFPDPPMRKSVLTLGTFDGVHRGHQAILKRVVSAGRFRKASSVVLAFGVPPRHAGDSLSRPVLISTPQEKAELIKRLGIQKHHVLVFDRKTANTPAEAFFTQSILRRHRALVMIVGPRLAFGKDRAGRLPLLQALGKRFGVKIEVVPPVGKGLGTVSSSKIRSLLQDGHVEKASAMLGYPFSIEGTVVHGDRRGRKLGFPTANLHVDPRKILPPGVFWVKVLPGKAAVPLSRKEAFKGWDALCNVGTRPTFNPGAHQLRCEVFLLQGPKHLYGKKLRVVFLKRIRREQRYSTPQALQKRIALDLQIARRWMTSA